jgi:hypothetical protein
MKASVGTLALIGAVLLAGSALAQTAPQPRSGTTPATGPRATVTSVSTGGQSGSENGDARATINSSGAVIAAESSAPVNGIGGTGGGRMSNGGHSENGETRATANPSGESIDIESWSWGRIDRVNTIQACAARGGVVVMHEGVQQCRLPATARREDPNRAMGSESTTR